MSVFVMCLRCMASRNAATINVNMSCNILWRKQPMFFFSKGQAPASSGTKHAATPFICIVTKTPVSAPVSLLLPVL